MSDDAARIEALTGRVRDLEATLRQNDAALAVTFGLSVIPSNLLGLLISCPLVTTAMVQQRMEVTTDAKVAIHRLRKCLDPFGVKIESKRGVGYWLTPDTKAMIRALIAPVTQKVTEETPSSDTGETVAA